jgi:predicted RNase H-like HicB family nuclease
MRDAVAVHLRGMRESGEEIPAPTSQAVYVAA